MIVTIHQPNFAPWTGFFDKLSQADAFVLLDTVPFSKGSFQNRVRVLGGDGTQWLTVPVLTKGRLGQPTNEVEINEAKPWRDEHRKTIQALYGRAAAVGDVLGLLDEVASRHPASGSPVLLADYCADVVEMVVERLGWGTRLVRASELAATGTSSELLAAIVAELGGDVYLSGPSGRSYLEESVLTAARIGVEYHQFVPRPYPQAGVAAFVPGLSVLDCVANVGWAAASEVLHA